MTTSSRMQVTRVTTVRFGLIAAAGLSAEWEERFARDPGWQQVRALVAAAADETAGFGPAEVEQLLALVGALLDRFDGEPTGELYYPFKCLELVELHCRMATGDLSDSAPVGLDEWIDRFAHHVDWQLEKSDVADRVPDRFRDLERTLWPSRGTLTGADDEAFRAAIVASREAAAGYAAALRSALGPGQRGTKVRTFS